MEELRSMMGCEQPGSQRKRELVKTRKSAVCNSMSGGLTGVVGVPWGVSKHLATSVVMRARAILQETAW
jgi:hypothetical protein